MTYAFEVLPCARAARELIDFEGNTSVVTVVLALAVANVGLGFALAVALDRLPVLSIPQFKRRTKTAESSDNLAAPENDDRTAEVAPRDEWSQKLKDAEVDPKSVIERLLWIIKLETISCRERLIELDRVFFDPHSPQPIASELTQELKTLLQLIESWIEQAEDEKEQAGTRGRDLEELLLDQAFRLQPCVDGLAKESRDDVAQHLATAMTAVNILRDRVDAILCELLTAEDRLSCVADRYRTCGQRDMLTHLGLATLFDEWWSDDAERVRLVSLVMLDLDRFEPFTQKIGAARSDIALLRFGDMLHDLLRKDRGFDRVAQYSGQRFIMFLGDTSSKNAAKGAERIRQTIEATSFKLGEETSEVTASLAVIEVGKSEGPSEFIPRMEATLDECKKAGRNCGYVDSGHGPEPIQLPQYQVSVHVIELEQEVAE